MRGAPKQRPVHYPFWSMYMEAGTPEYDANRHLEDLRKNYLTRLITASGSGFDSLWDEYTDAVCAVDQQPMLDFFNAESAKRVAAFGN